MALEVALICGGVLVLSLLLTGRVRRVAMSLRVLDVPNERSSHSTPTPRGGGVAIVLASCAGFVAAYAIGSMSTDLLVALLGGGGAVAIIGAIDDRWHVASQIRLTVHFAAAIWALAWLGGPALGVDEPALAWRVASYVASALAIAWMLNLFNFMDGIDGIAAVEAIFVSWGAAALTLLGPGANEVAIASLVLGTACCGFLYWNWPPARIFMGDSGSGFLGFVLAVLALSAARDSVSAPAVWALLVSVFLADATVTLLRRLARRQRLDQAHREHAYQWLARRWSSHKRVTLAVLGVNVLLLLPAAALATRYARFALWILIAVYVPLIFFAVRAGAGRREPRTDS